MTVGDKAMAHCPQPVAGLPGRGDGGTGARKEREEDTEGLTGAL